MGISLALLLGAMAGFFIFAIPQSLLEQLTTVTGLSRIMVQAEPPISANDRGLLAILAGLGTAGLGWVLIDWLLFGRAGLSALIKPREDEYEDDGDDYHPANPLDLVTSDLYPRNSPVPEVPMLDPRRPLSARTDIGDPPVFPQAAGPGAGPHDTYDIELAQWLPPLDQLLPETPRAPPLPLNTAIDAIPVPLPSVDLPDVAPTSAPPTAPVPGPLIFPSAAEMAAAAAGTAFSPPAGLPSKEAPLIAPAASPLPAWPEPSSDIVPPPPSPAPPPPATPVAPDALTQFFASFPPELPDLPAGQSPLILPDSNGPGGTAGSRPEASLRMPPMAAQVTPPPPPANVSSPAEIPEFPWRPAEEAARIERPRLEDLLARLEYGMLKRRESAPSIGSAFVPSPEAVRPPLPVYAAAPTRMVDALPPMSIAQTPAPVIPAVIPAPPAPTLPVSRESADLLNEPLYKALDVLRNRVRRSG